MTNLEKLKPGDRFRVAGDRSTFTCVEKQTTGRGGRLPVVMCWSEDTGFRFLYVGDKPTRSRGLLIRPYRITKILRGKA